MEDLRIGEVARQARIPASTIRYYESIGLLPLPPRVNGRRQYDSTILQRLAIIRLAQESGFSLAEIATLFHGFAPETPPSERWYTLAQMKLAEADALIRRAQRMKQLLEHAVACECLTFEECMVVLEQTSVEDTER